MKIYNSLSRILYELIFLVFLLFLSSAGFQDSRTSGWYQQFFPNLNGSTIKDITFLDSLTGFAVTTPDASDIGYILKTSNGGDNWYTVHTYPPPNGNVGFTRIKFATDSIGYASSDYLHFFRTTNAGLNWSNISEPPWGLEDMSVVNKDTIFSVSSSGFGGGVYRSTNGGYNWHIIWSMGGGGNPQKIYMVNKDLGFTQDEGLSNYMKRTTNGGFNWAEISGEKFKDIVFFDNHTGWKVYSSIKKTTDGGISWFVQQTPNITTSFTNKADLCALNKDTVWMVGAYYNNGGVVFKTTNGGTNWGYQIPNTSYPVTSLYNINFVDSKQGWVFVIYGTNNLLFHTKVGGNDTTYYTGLKLVPSIVLEMFSLGQNYPNPFNPTTNIPYELKEPSHVTLKVYDLQGKEVKELVNGRWGTGKFIADFEGAEFSTGVYFYKIVLYGESSKQTFSETKRMLMIK